MSLSRRELFVGAAALPSLLSRREALSWFGGEGAKPKNIIFMVADGMADQVPAMADHYQRLTAGHRSYWTELMGEDYAHNGLQATRSLNSVVTDSSAASSSWGSGRHIWNGQLNMYPDKTALRPILDVMQEGGKRTGLVTTTTITHATPAGFAVSVVQRDMEEEIARKYAASGVDVLMGGGRKFFDSATRKDKTGLYPEFAKAGYKIMRSKADMAATEGRVLGLFADSHLPYSIDRDHSPDLGAQVPSLSEMVTYALANLKSSPNGFVLQVEGGRVDHGGHSTDFGAMLFDQIEFERAVKVAVEFALQDRNTLVIITADHATGGPSLNGDGDEYIDATKGLLTAQNMTCSFAPLRAAMGIQATADSAREAVKAKYGLEIKPEEGEAIAAGFANKSPLKLAKFCGGATATLGAILGNYSRVTFTSGNHTSEHVLVTAVGPGAEAIHGVKENVWFNQFLLDQMGLKHENPPQMSFEDAARHYEVLKKELGGGTYSAEAHAEEVM